MQSVTVTATGNMNVVCLESWLLVCFVLRSVRDFRFCFRGFCDNNCCFSCDGDSQAEAFVAWSAGGLFNFPCSIYTSLPWAIILYIQLVNPPKKKWKKKKRGGVIIYRNTFYSLSIMTPANLSNFSQIKGCNCFRIKGLIACFAEESSVIVMLNYFSRDKV